MNVELLIKHKRLHNGGGVLLGRPITIRQREVLKLVAAGKTGKEIANAYSISPKTVEFHKAGLMDRLGIRTTAGLTKYALQEGLA